MIFVGKGLAYFILAISLKIGENSHLKTWVYTHTCMQLNLHISYVINQQSQ